MNAPPPPPPPRHDDDAPVEPTVEARAIGRRSADRLVVAQMLAEHEARQRERVRALVWKLIVPAASLLGGALLAFGFGYVTPSSRIAAVERAQAEIRAEQALTRRQLSSLLIIRCLDAQTSRDILIAAGVNCTELMRENGLR